MFGVGWGLGGVNTIQDHFFKQVNETTAHGETPVNIQTVRQPHSPSQDRQFIAWVVGNNDTFRKSPRRLMG